MLRSIISVGCETILSREKPAGTSRRKLGGAGGCMAMAGGRLTTSLSARMAPMTAAVALSAPAMA